MKDVSRDVTRSHQISHLWLAFEGQLDMLFPALLSVEGGRDPEVEAILAFLADHSSARVGEHRGKGGGCVCGCVGVCESMRLCVHVCM